MGGQLSVVGKNGRAIVRGGEKMGRELSGI